MLEALEKRREFLAKWRDSLLSAESSPDRLRIVTAQFWEAGSRLMVYGDLGLFAKNPESVRKPLEKIFTGIDSENPENYLRGKIRLADEMEKEAEISGMMDESDRKFIFKMAAAIRSECNHAIGLIHGGADFLIPGDDTMIADIAGMSEKNFEKMIAEWSKQIAEIESGE